MTVFLKGIKHKTKYFIDRQQYDDYQQKRGWGGRRGKRGVNGGKGRLDSGWWTHNMMYTWCIVELYPWNLYHFINQCHPNKVNKNFLSSLKKAILSGAQVGLQLWVHETEFILALLLINYCMVFPADSCRPTLPCPVFSILTGFHRLLTAEPSHTLSHRLFQNDWFQNKFSDRSLMGSSFKTKTKINLNSEL